MSAKANHSALRVCVFRFLGVASAAFLICFSLSAQINTGRILGTVTDQTGGVIAGAMVTVTNSQTGVARNLVADDAGEYNAPNLTPGTYTVRMTANGFQAFERQNILLEVGKDARIDAQLTPGQISQTIEVSAAIPLLDSTSATITGNLNTATVVDLPLNGRNYQNLLQYRPGVTTRPGGGTLTTSTNGLRPEDNNYYVEGLDVDEPFTGQSIMNSTLPSGDAATFLPIDAIQEVNVETNAPAEFGKRPGAVINTGIKAGTNSIHGTAYAFGRSDKFDSAEYSFAPSTKAPAELEQWGGTVGGPIVKNKLFYFGGFERQTYNVGSTWSINAPTSALTSDPGQSIPAATAALAASCAAKPAQTFCGPGGTFSVNPVTAKILPLFGTNMGPTSAQAYGFPDVVSIYNIVGKIDYHMNDHHAFTGSYFFGNGSSSAEDTAITQAFFESLGKLRSQFVTASWTWTPNSVWLNDLRLGANFHHRTVVTADSTTALNSYGINTGVTNPFLGGFPTIQVSGFSQLGGDNNLPKDYGPSYDYDLVDHVSYLRGKHAFKFGAEVFYERPFFGNFSAGRGQIMFNGGSAFSKSTALEDFLAGVPDATTGANILNGDPRRQLTQWDYSTFVEDVWRVRQDVTVNLGLRYEYFTPLSDTRKLIGNWDPQLGLEQVGVNTNSAYKPYHKDFSPRLGVAWDVGGKGKTIVRAGGGIYYVDLVVGAMVDNISLPGKPSGITSIPTAYSIGADGTQAPINPITSGGIGTATISFPGSQLNWSSLSGPIFPAGQIGSAKGFQCGDGLKGHPAPCSVLAMNKNIIPPQVNIWTLGVQRTLTNNYTLEVNYIGDHSSNLVGIQDLNAINPQNPGEQLFVCGKPAGTQNHCELQSDRPYYGQFPYLKFINYMSNLDKSNYNALQTTLTARSYHGLGFVAAYTYSHALDDSSQNRNQNVPMNNLAPALDYGNSDFDQRHHFGLTLGYDIPGRKGFGQMLEGWRINSAVLIQSGLPWNAIDTGNDIPKTGDKKEDRWDFFGNPKDFAAGKSPIPFYAGGSTTMPALCTQDAASIGASANLAKFGCYAQGNSVLIAPPTGSFGTGGRNIFRDNGFRDWDFSLFKNWTVKERLTAQFRLEVFNILNHSILANPGAAGNNALTGTSTFGCSCITPDNAGQNPILGNGSSRAMQLGLKLLF
jgi:hypothetical protein